MTDKFHSTYETTLFIGALEREVIKALVVILRLKIETEMEVGVIKMVYNIIKAYVSYDFTSYLSKEMKRNLENLDIDKF